MRFGTAKELITPDIKTHMGGYGTLYGKYFAGIHDELYVKSLLLDDGTSKLLLLSFDLLFHDIALLDGIKAYACGKYGICEDGVMLSCTHTHGGPALEGYDPGQSSEHYEAFLLQRVKSCVDRTFVNTFEGSICFGKVEGDWNINRRKNIDGKMAMMPNPEGLKDNAINILKVCDCEGNIRVLMLNYACHPVTLRDTVYLTAEYPGRLCQLLDTEFYGCTTIFFQGAGANSRPRATASGNTFKKCTFDEVDDMAAAMASNVKKAICRNSLKEFEPDLAARQFDIKLNLEVYPKETFEKIYEELQEGSLKNEAREIVECYDRKTDFINLHAGIFRLSDDIYMAFMGGEPCYEVKLNVEKAFEGKKIIFVGYVDAIAYIPDDKIIQEGGYEAEGSVVEYRLKGRIKPGADKTVLDAFAANLQCMKECKADKIVNENINS